MHSCGQQQAYGGSHNDSMQQNAGSGKNGQQPGHTGGSYGQNGAAAGGKGKGARKGADRHVQPMPKFSASMGFAAEQQPWQQQGSGQGSRQGGKGKGRSEKSRGDPSSNLYVRGLPPSTTEGQLYRTFGKAGKVLELKILRYPDSQDCSALVRMDSVQSATNGIDMLSGTVPEGVVPPMQVSFQGKGATAPSDNLYVKGLPADCTADDVQMLFSQIGNVRRHRLLPPSSGTSSATLDAAALVQMSSIDEAQKAIEALNGTLPPGPKPQMWIRFAEAKSSNDKGVLEPTNNLYIKGLPVGTSNYLLRLVFGQYGTVTWLRVMSPKDASAASDCVALVEMASVAEATAAVQGLHGRVLAAPMPPMRVRYAGKDQKPGTNLYVAGLAPVIQEQQLHQTFEKVGKVVRLRLLLQAGSSETHALVQMGSLEEAQRAIEQLNDVVPESAGPLLIVRYARERIHKTGGAGEGNESGNAEAIEATSESI